MDIHVGNDELARANKLISILRTALGISSADLAGMLGLTREHVLRVESGKYKVMTTVYLASCFIFNTLARATNNSTALAMMYLLVDVNKKANLPDDMKVRCIERCWRAKQNSPRRFGVEYAQSNVSKEFENWLKEEYFEWKTTQS